ncbi:hypothetical protein BCR44DRAFT_1426921 [Catenaria anguillulae PL171]|uniref:Bromo domain-containing protein n=1 Tax=Catenaria anguillulae PL171 TaxID=765915 RepID=A0A1Y2I0X6_9FUNG|nr:hypothetical protein BCR44DRAFT_1426921 [Catenaria anguillulae PL171]
MTMSPSQSHASPDAGTAAAPAAVPWSTKDFLLLFSAIARDKPMTAQAAQSIPWTTVKQLTAACPLASPHLQRASIAKLEWYYCQFIAAEPFGHGLSLQVILQVLFSRRLRELFNDIQSEDQSLREELRQLGALPLPTPAQQLSLATGSTSNPHAAVPDALRSPIATALTPLSPAITLSDGPLSPQVIPLGSPRPHSSFHSYLASSSAAANPPPTMQHRLPSSDASTSLSATPRPPPPTPCPSRTSLDAAHARSTSVTPTPRSPSVFHAGGAASGSGPPPPAKPPARSSMASSSSSSPPKLVLKSTFGAVHGDAVDSDGGVPLPARHVRTVVASLEASAEQQRTLASRRANPPAPDTSLSAAPMASPPLMHSPTWTDASMPSTPLDERDMSSSSRGSSMAPLGLPSSSSTSAPPGLGTARQARGSTPGARARRASLKQADDRHRHWRKSCLRKWDDIADARLGHTFSTAIKADNAHNYRAVIKHPMDLKAVKQRLRDGKTSSTDGFHRDLVLMMANARMYYGNMGDWKGLVDEMKGEVDRQLTEFRVMERMANARMGAPSASASASASSAGSSAASSSADLPGVVVKVEQGAGGF